MHTHELHVMTGAPVKVEVHVRNSNNRYVYRSQGLSAEVRTVLHSNRQFSTKILIKEVITSFWLLNVIVNCFRSFLIRHLLHWYYYVKRKPIQLENSQPEPSTGPVRYPSPTRPVRQDAETQTNGVNEDEEKCRMCGRGN